MNENICWYCDKKFTYPDPKYRCIRCPNCGVENDIFNPDKPDWKPEPKATSEQEWLNEEDKKMGKLADRAREKSPFIKLEIGEETPILIYKSWKETTDNFGNDTFRYFFDLETENGIVSKHLDNRSQSFAEAMDKIEFGTKVIIKREQKLDNEGDPIEKKSVWTVRKAE